MKLYTFDVRLTGYQQVTVKASSVEEAREKALQRFEAIYKAEPAWSLRQKEVELDPLCKNARG